MSDCLQVLTRKKAQVIAQAVSGITNTRVKLGIVDDTSLSTFFSDMVNSGPYVVIEPAIDSDFEMQAQLGDFEVPVLLWFGWTANAAYDFTAIENIKIALRTALATASNWRPGNGTDGAIPQHISVNELERRTDNPAGANVNIGLYRFKLRFKGN